MFGRRIDSAQAVVDQLKKERDAVTHELRELIKRVDRLVEERGPFMQVDKMQVLDGKDMEKQAERRWRAAAVIVRSRRR